MLGVESGQLARLHTSSHVWPELSISTAARAAREAPAGGWRRALSTLTPCQSLRGGCCVGSSLKRRLHSTRSLENLSSGEKRAGCAEKVGEPSGAAFCGSTTELRGNTTGLGGTRVHAWQLLATQALGQLGTL